MCRRDSGPRLAPLALALVLSCALPACTDAPIPAGDGGPGEAGACTTHADCSDGVYCNGREVCISGACLHGVVPCQASQVCDEAIDHCLTDCTIERDADHDSYDALECGGTDCDDADARRHPGATEICEADDIDEDCDTATFGVRDADGDGIPDATCCNVLADGTRHCGDDCDDARSVVHPGNTEACDTFDNDCDSAIDEGVSFTCYVDGDDDSFAPAGAVPMSACGCPAGTTTREPGPGTTDCDDADRNTSPHSVEVCDLAGRDEDCDGFANPASLCACSDGATRACVSPGRCASGTETCLTGVWSVCSIQPRDEICNAEDDDCDGRVDEGTQLTCATDADRDRYAPAGAATIQACACPDATTSMLPSAGATDCDDTRANVNPGLPEVCDAAMLDENCDGVVNPPSDCSCATGMTRPCAAPGACATGVQVCASGAWGACSVVASAEVCNLTDDDCDGLVDEGTQVSCYTDSDNDGYPRSNTPTLACTCGAGTTRNSPALMGTDCSDTNGTIHPGAPEVCDRIDSNCSSGGGVATNEDADGDGYATSAATCTGGYPKTDCNDGNASIHPGATELCDLVDSDCSGSATSEDADGDGYASVSASCSGGYPKTDCNDASASVHPGAAESCDRIDSDCNGLAEDADMDGFSPLDATCTGGFPKTDCDDTRASIAPCAPGCTGIYNAPHRYAVCTTAAVWTAAQATCTGMTMDLVSIGSATENTWVRGRLSSTTYTNIWTGGTDVTTEGVWLWSDGTQFWMGGAAGASVGGAYTHWSTGQPDNSSGQDYMALIADGTWADFDGGTARVYVCESH